MPGQTNTIDLVLEASSLAHETALAADLYAMPATQGQVRFWSLDQLNPGNPALNMPLMWQCTGALNVDAMRLAFIECVRRHESLRTTFSLIDGELSQIIHPEMAMLIPLEDLTSLSGEAQRLEADRITRDHAAFRFDLVHRLRLAVGARSQQRRNTAGEASDRTNRSADARQRAGLRHRRRRRLDTAVSHPAARP